MAESDTDKIAEYSKLAKEKISKGEFTDAEYVFKKITKIDPTNWQAWQGRGLCFKRMEMWERAVYAFGEVTKIAENNPKGWYNLGFCQSQLDHIEEALFSLNKAIKLDPSYAIAQIIKAWIFKQHDNEKQADKLISHVKKNYPEFMNKFSKREKEKQPLDYQIAIKLVLENGQG